jgi:ribosomal protein S18 acetylase RimI-like enzyme
MRERANAGELRITHSIEKNLPTFFEISPSIFCNKLVFIFKIEKLILVYFGIFFAESKNGCFRVLCPIRQDKDNPLNPTKRKGFLALTEERSKMKNESQNSEELICRLIQKKDYPEIIKLMKDSNIPVAGLYCTSIYTAIYHQALTDDRIVFGVAEYDGKLIGLIIAIIDWNKFWTSFLTKHPLLALHILFVRLIRKAGIGVIKSDYDSEQLKAIEKYLTTSIANRSWKDSSPQIAKAIFISVDPKYRGQKIGLELNRFRDKVFVERGVTRYDGWVEMHRIPQIHLLHKTGFLIERRGDKFFVSKDL